MYRGLTSNVAYPQSFSLDAIFFPLCSYELRRIRDLWGKTTRGLWSFLSPIAMDTVFRHDILGDQPEVLDCMPDSWVFSL